MEEHQISEEQLKEIASQLSCPKGVAGIKTAELMNINNIGMTKNTIASLNILEKSSVLEIGPGNASHLRYLLNFADVNYFGIDISTTMIDEASRINKAYIDKKQASFTLVAEEEIPFSSHFFDHIFTVNTLYFWKTPKSYTKEIKRVMKAGATLAIGFADKAFMEKLPFTLHGFNLYTIADVENLLLEAGFEQINFQKKEEQMQISANDFVSRTYYIATAIA